MNDQMSSSPTTPVQPQATAAVNDKNEALAALFVGKSKHSAHDLAEAKNVVFRLVSVDGEIFLGYPADIRDDRICAEIVNGKVVVAKVC